MLFLGLGSPGTWNFDSNLCKGYLTFQRKLRKKIFLVDWDVFSSLKVSFQSVRMLILTCLLGKSEKLPSSCTQKFPLLGVGKLDGPIVIKFHLFYCKSDANLLLVGYYKEPWKREREGFEIQLIDSTRNRAAIRPKLITSFVLV